MAELIAIPLKKPSDVEMIKPLQNVIKSAYTAGSKVKDYTDAITEFNKLRNNALWRAFEKHESSLENLYRYHDQLSALEAKIPAHELSIPFKWKDAFDRTIFGGKLSLTINTLAYEKVCVLFNIAALQSSVAASQSLENDEGLKLAAKLFSQSAGVFNYLKGSTLLAIQQEPTPDLSPETLEALAALMLAQAQEIFTLKAIHDNMKDLVVAKLAAQAEDYYAEALKLFQKEIFRAFWDKDWIPIIAAKQASYRALAEYYQSLVCKSNKAVGHEIARLEHSVELFKSAQTRCPKLTFFQDFANKAARNLAEVKKDNDFIYHERIPDVKTLDPITKAPIAKMTSVPDKFSTNFRDLFSDLLPVPIHHALASYESHKSEVVNIEITKLRDMKQVMNGILASLNLPAAIEDVSGVKVPQSLLEKSATVREAGGIEALEKSMNELPDLFQRNKDILDECNKMLEEEQQADDHLRSQFKEKWSRLPSTRLTEQFRVNCQKYRGIINNAINADKIVRQKFEKHREAVNILSMEPNEISRMIPAGAAIKENQAVFDLRKLMEDVETIRAEQDVIESELKSATTDMKAAFLSALIKDGGFDESSIIKEGLSTCYKPLQKQVQECEERQKKLINEIQTKHAQFTQEQASTGNAREEMLCKLAAAYDAFKELRNNLKEGIQFYNDLTQLLIGLQNKISDFAFARKTEKEELLKDLTSSLSHNDQKPSNINIPPHHSQNPQGQNPLPYPTSNQGGMPIPFATMQAPYPQTYAPPPMPQTYNPYATMHYPVQPGYVMQQPPMPQAPYGNYATLPSNFQPGGNRQ